MVNNNLDDLVLFTENPGCVIIDVRSESEFELDHIPGSINFPVLNDDERKEVGTIYKKNPFTAKQLGARLISSNISKILQKIEDLIEEKSINPSKVEFKIYCWRGGMRSRSLFIVMEMIGYKVSLIKGGYKEYRKGIINYLSEFQSENLLVIHGLSGSGKTEILEILEKEHF
ncbi:MAG: hypothetical protein KDK36_15330, partial [Leptospiraceae bacterium]|nr:hypothetical protein [Leptospiraceae bacterium]